ncbi:MAG: hypothetical protein CMM05_03225 [Rhodopirellula sp.]|nr:hypothetical protein [Rhodopirellula sp.]
MPLLKLWNSLRGQSTTTPEPKAEESQNPTTQVSQTSAKSPSKAVKRPTKTTFGMFGGGPHSGLCKLLKPLSVHSVLEVGVGDGSQAIAVMETLSRQSDSIRYYAVDEFEMAGGVNLKQFHQRLRNHNLHPQLFPGPVDRGLTKIAHTIGSVDLILVANASAIDNNPAVTGMLARISHEGTGVLVSRNDTWSLMEVSIGNDSRRAA